MVPSSDQFGLGRVGIGDADEFDVAQCTQDAGMGLAKMADTDDRDPQFFVTHWAFCNPEGSRGETKG